jgi:hypothetical protein
VRDLRGHYGAVSAGPLATAFAATPVGKTVAAAPELGKIDEFARQLGQVLGMDPARLREEVFGDAVVFAYQNGGPGSESAVILSWARDPKVATRMMERLNEAQTKSGELKSVNPLTHDGHTYYQRVKQPGKGADEFYYQKDSIIAFSQQDAAIRRLIDRDRDIPRDGAMPPALARHKAESAFATLWVNPRSFDAELAAKLKQAEPGEAAFLQTFQQIWSATDGFALTLRLEKHLELNLSVATRPDALPPALRRFGAAAREPSALAKLFPPDAMLAVAGRFDLSATLDLVTAIMTPDARQSLKASLEQSLGSVFGKSDLPQLPDHLGPDWGFCVTAPPVDSKAVLPEFVVALRVRPGKDGAKVEQSLLDAMNKVATLAEIAYNFNHKDSLERKTTRAGDADVVYLTAAGLPAGVQPAYALKDGFLFIATHPDAVTRLKPGKAPAEDRLLVLSFRNVDRYLSARADDLKQFLVTQNKTPAEDAAHQIAQLRAGLELLDRLELVNESHQPGQAKLTVRLHFTAALRK